MKTNKTTAVGTRLDPETRAEFYKKARKEKDHDPSSVLRELIKYYILKGLPNVN